VGLACEVEESVAKVVVMGAVREQEEKKVGAEATGEQAQGREAGMAALAVMVTAETKAAEMVDCCTTAARHSLPPSGSSDQKSCSSQLRNASPPELSAHT